MASAALWPFSAERLFLICGSETPAGVSEPLFHEKDPNWKRLLGGKIPRFPLRPLLRKCVCCGPQAATNAKYKQIFLYLWPERKRRPFSIVCVQKLPLRKDCAAFRFSVFRQLFYPNQPCRIVLSIQITRRMVVFWLTNFKKNGTIEKSSIGGRLFIQAPGKLTDQRDGPKTKGMVTILPWARTN